MKDVTKMNLSAIQTLPHHSLAFFIFFRGLLAWQARSQRGPSVSMLANHSYAPAEWEGRWSPRLWKEAKSIWILSSPDFDALGSKIKNVESWSLPALSAYMQLLWSITCNWTSDTICEQVNPNFRSPTQAFQGLSQLRSFEQSVQWVIQSCCPNA